MASFLRKRMLHTPPRAAASLGLYLVVTLMLCGSASADPIGSLETSTASQASATVAPVAQAEAQPASVTQTAPQILAATTAATPIATHAGGAEPAQSTPEPLSPPSPPSPSATARGLDETVRVLATPASAIHAASSVTRTLAVGGDYAHRVVSHTLSHGVEGLERVTAETTASTLDRVSSSAGGIARHAPHTLGPALADRTSQIISQPTEDTIGPLSLAPATDTQPAPSLRGSGAIQAAGPHTPARAGAASFLGGSRTQIPLARSSYDPGMPVGSGPAPSASQHRGGAAPPASSPTPGASGSSAALSAAAGSGGLLFLTLIGLLALAGSWSTYRLRILDDAPCPAPFVLIPQRPG
jgi:hypothetical protein